MAHWLLRSLLTLVPLTSGQEPFDLACVGGKNAASWKVVKQHFRGLFETSVFEGLPRSKLIATREAVLQELNSVKALDANKAMDECGLGRLSLQLLSANTIEDPLTLAQLFSGVQNIADPVMTTLLDVPWIALAESGWPIFGFLSQLNNRRLSTEFVNTPEADGLTTDAARAFMAELTAALGKGDVKELRTLSAIVLNTELLQGNPMASLTAVATQAAVEPNPQGRIQVLGMLQRYFRDAFGSASELDFALGSRWPLWGLVHTAVDALAVGLASAPAR